MRLTQNQIQIIQKCTQEIAGNQAKIRVFGSRLDHTARGGDIDLLLERPEAIENPALLAVQLSAKISHAMHGRKIDVLLCSQPYACLFMKQPLKKVFVYECKKASCATVTVLGSRRC